MYAVATLASLLDSIRYLASSAEWEAAYEDDGSALPAQLKEWLAVGGTLLGAMVTEEVAELTADKAAAVALEKAGARHSKSDLEKLQGIHDHAAAMGAACSAEKGAVAGDLEKVTTLEKQLGDVTTERDALAKRIAALEAEPTAPKGALKVIAIDKAHDAGSPLTDETEQLDPNDPQFSLKVMKLAQRRGVAIGPR